MNADRIAHVAGTLGLVYGGFSRKEELHETRLGALAPAEAKGEATVPARASLGTLAMGGVRRLFRARGR